jgi:hypothetical protein
MLTGRGADFEVANVPGVTNLESMTTRGGHYTALVEALDHQGGLHVHERDQVMAAADALLFGEPGGEQTLRAAQDVIETLETSGRCSAESCDRLREHLYGCDASPR